MKLTRTTRAHLVELVVLTVGTTLTFVLPASAQCAMCRSLLRTSEGQRLVAGFREGILLLLAAPFLALGTVAILAVRAQRRLTRAEDDADGASGCPSLKDRENAAAASQRR